MTKSLTINFGSCSAYGFNFLVQNATCAIDVCCFDVTSLFKDKHIQLVL